MGKNIDLINNQITELFKVKNDAKRNLECTKELFSTYLKTVKQAQRRSQKLNFLKLNTIGSPGDNQVRRSGFNMGQMNHIVTPLEAATLNNLDVKVSEKTEEIHNMEFILEELEGNQNHCKMNFLAANAILLSHPDRL